MQYLFTLLNIQANAALQHRILQPYTKSHKGTIRAVSSPTRLSEEPFLFYLHIQSILLTHSHINELTHSNIDSHIHELTHLHIQTIFISGAKVRFLF